MGSWECKLSLQAGSRQQPTRAGSRSGPTAAAPCAPPTAAVVLQRIGCCTRCPLLRPCRSCLLIHCQRLCCWCDIPCRSPWRLQLLSASCTRHHLLTTAPSIRARLCLCVCQMLPRHKQADGRRQGRRRQVGRRHLRQHLQLPACVTAVRRVCAAESTTATGCPGGGACCLRLCACTAQCSELSGQRRRRPPWLLLLRCTGRPPAALPQGRPLGRRRLAGAALPRIPRRRRLCRRLQHFQHLPVVAV